MLQKGCGLCLGNCDAATIFVVPYLDSKHHVFFILYFFYCYFWNVLLQGGVKLLNIFLR